MRSVALYSLILTSACATFACSKGDKADSPVVREHVAEATAGTLNVSVTFPNDAVKGVTNSVHIFVLNSLYDAGNANCADLVGRALDPYSTTLGRAADFVSKDSLDAISVPNVNAGKALVYVEAVDYGGQVEWAGCVEVTVTGGATSAAVTLARAGVYDCTDPNTKDGSLCDDGFVCTIGEKCKAGACQGGQERDCDAFADQCNAKACDETKGCYAKPLANTTPCDDDNPCTTSDACQSGTCTGVARDCSKEANTCEIAIGCNQFTGLCEFSYKPYNTPCEDGLFCTVNDYCGSSGTCYSGGSRDCSALSNACQTGTCDETTKACTATNVKTTCGYTASSGLDCYVDVCDPVLGCNYTPKPVGTQCASYGYTTCSLYSSSLAGVPHCDALGDCYYYVSGTAGSYGCY